MTSTITTSNANPILVRDMILATPGALSHCSTLKFSHVMLISHYSRFGLLRACRLPTVRRTEGKRRGETSLMRYLQKFYLRQRPAVIVVVSSNLKNVKISTIVELV